MYSKHCIGFFANSRFNQILFFSMLHEPHFVFMSFIRQSFALTPVFFSHLSRKEGLFFFNGSRYNSFIGSCRLAIEASFLTYMSMKDLLRNKILCLGSDSITRIIYLVQ